MKTRQRKEPPPSLFQKNKCSWDPRNETMVVSTSTMTHPFRWRTTRTKLTFRHSVPIGTAAPSRTRIDFPEQKNETWAGQKTPPPPFIFIPRSLLLLDLRVALEPRHGPFHDQTQLAKSQAPPPSSQQTAAPHQRQESRQAPLSFLLRSFPRWLSSRVLGPHKRTHHHLVQFQIQDHHKPKTSQAICFSRFDDPVRTSTSSSFSRVLTSPSPPFAVAVARSHKCKRNLLHKFHFKLMSPQTALQLTEKIWSGQV